MAENDRRSRCEALFAAHARAVWGYARRRASAATADDVLSDVFMVAWRRLDDLPADARPWLLACARRALGNHDRGARRRARLIVRLSTTAREDAPLTLADGALAAALAMLSERDREALLLTAWEGLSVEGAAAVLGCSVPALRKRLQRARSRLLVALAEAGAIPNPLKIEVQ